MNTSKKALLMAAAYLGSAGFVMKNVKDKIAEANLIITPASSPPPPPPPPPSTTRQALVPGVGYVNETTTTQQLIPGLGYINEGGT